MMITFNSRRDQFSYFLGFVAKANERQLHLAVDKFLQTAHQGSLPEEAFDICPFNDTQEHLIRAIRIFENGKSDFALNLERLLEEYLFLVSDFEPPCCGDGRSFYCQASHGEIVLECDKCNKIYALDENEVQKTDVRKMRKNDFVALVGKETALNWPYHSKLQRLLIASN
jgi:hypothetical protein